MGENLWLGTRGLNILTTQLSISDLVILSTGQTHLESGGQKSGQVVGAEEGTAHKSYPPRT